MAQAQGKCDERFAKLKQLLEHHVETGDELGASICVNIGGEDVVDIWAGYTDESRQQRWQENTITNVWSTTKNITALAALILVERGQLDVEQNVSYYWPEFAANGKENVKIKHILSHTSGLAGWEEKITIEDVCNFEKAANLLAEQEPWWVPGSASGYHSTSMGHLVGEVIKRITGKNLKQFVAEEMAGPLGADFQIGAREEDWPRISHVIPPPVIPSAPRPRPGSIAWKTFTNPISDANFTKTATWKNAILGASNGHGNARSITRMHSVVTLDGKPPGLDTPLLSPKTIDLIFQVQAHGIDRAVKAPLKFGIGFGLAGEDTFLDFLPRNRICFWCGWGGSFGLIDMTERLTVGYAMNKMDGAGILSHGLGTYLPAVYEALGYTIANRKANAKL